MKISYKTVIYFERYLTRLFLILGVAVRREGVNYDFRDKRFSEAL